MGSHEIKRGPQVYMKFPGLKGEGSEDRGSRRIGEVPWDMEGL